MDAGALPPGVTSHVVLTNRGGRFLLGLAMGVEQRLPGEGKLQGEQTWEIPVKAPRMLVVAQGREGVCRLRS